MALFEGESFEDFEEEEANKYLDDPEMGMELIKSMLLRKEETREGAAFDHMIRDEIFPILAEFKLRNELEIYQALVKIGNKMKDQYKIRLLEGKKVLGVGGRFSAGKSCFINSITNAQLPEGQRPTTSIATYIINAEKKKYVAVTQSDAVVDLDGEAVEALTHRFYEKYRIGFSKVIKNLVIHTPNFTYPNIAILDTPGYSKSDASKKEDSSDARLAREQLKSADYLIWLVDAEQGVVTQRDVEFLSSLCVSTKILVIFTKADCEEESNLKKKVAQAKEVLLGINKDIYDVIAYDSIRRQTLLGEGVLERFLDMVNGSEVQGDEITAQIKSIYSQLRQQFKEQKDGLAKKYDTLEEILAASENVEHISAVIQEHGRCKLQRMRLRENKKRLKSCFSRLIEIANKMKAVEDGEPR